MNTQLGTPGWEHSLEKDSINKIIARSAQEKKIAPKYFSIQHGFYQLEFKICLQFLWIFVHNFYAQYSEIHRS